MSCHARLIATVAVWIGVGAPAEAGDGRASAGAVEIDAIFVERAPAWWLVDDGVRRAAIPRWAADARVARELGADGARVVIDAIEAGEGGGYADETGLGPPPAPTKATACGIPLVTTARDVAVVFLRVRQGRPRVVRAARVADSRRASSPKVTSPQRREEGREHDPKGALDAARRRALLGDATGTQRLVGVARAQALLDDAASLDLLEAQALERTGRFREAALALVRFADRIERGARDPPHDDSALVAETAAEARRQAARTRARAGDSVASFDAASPLDAAIGRLPRLVAEGRTLDAVALVAHAIRGPPPPSVRSIARRRALLAATALALDADDAASARDLLRAASTGPLPDSFQSIFDALSERAEVRPPERTAPPAPAVGRRAPGG